MASEITLNRNLTAADCRKQRFTGIRADVILNQTEIWVMGNKVKEVSQLAQDMDPQALARAYGEVFGLLPDQVVIV